MVVRTMGAIQIHEFGGPEVLRYEQVPMPQLQPGELLVRAHAVGINPPDVYLREGYRRLTAEWRPQIPLPAIPGTDVSGRVEVVADDVTGFSPGDEVYAMVRFPSGLAGGSRAYAQYVTVPAAEAARKPDGMDHLHAAAAPMSLLTAWQFMVELGHDIPNPLQTEQHEPAPLEGRVVLVNGAAGGVGHFAVQIAKWKGARVIAVASGRHEALMADLGVDQFIDYRKTAVGEVVRGVDLVVDSVGGPATARFMNVLKPGGALFPIFPLGFAGAEEARRRGVKVSTTQVRSSGAQLSGLADLLQDGTIRVVLDSSFELRDARGAHEHLAAGHQQGKVVLAVS